MIGGGAPCFVIAEAGVNHNGDPALAHRLVEAAAAAGADAVKFQTFEPARLAAATAPAAEYQRARQQDLTSQREMLDQLVLPAAAWEALRDDATARGLLFLSTPFDEPSAVMLAELGVPAFKVSSGDVTNLPFLRTLATFGRPVLLSTGMSTLDEVETAVGAVRAGGDPPLALFHCVTSYPAAARDCNLRAMATLRSAFDVPVGWSDHTEGIHVAIAAVALGAEIIEKHFTLDRSLPGPDHQASLEPDALASMIGAVRDVRAALGDGRKVPAEPEHALAAVARRSLHAARDLPAGHTLTTDDVALLRPGSGLPAAALDALLGRSLRAPVAVGVMLREEDFA